MAWAVLAAPLPLLARSPVYATVLGYCRPNLLPVSTVGTRYAQQISRSAQYQYNRNQQKELSTLLKKDIDVARGFLLSLPPEARENLHKVLDEAREEAAADRAANASKDFSPIPMRQYIKIAIRAGAPFVVFGFIDNSIMIIAGETLDHTMGALLGLSTMAAAALGNLVSDVVGTGCGGMIQALADRFRMAHPDLTDEQRSRKSVTILKSASCVVGIAVGCVLGMWPIPLYSL